MTLENELGSPHPRFRVLWPHGGGLAMFAEFAQFLVDIPDAALLHPSAARDLGALDSKRHERLRANLEMLVAAGLWILGGGEPDSSAYILPDFDAAPRALEDRGSGGQWVTLADPREDPLIAMLATKLALPPAFAAVVVDDALDPRLDVLNRRLRAAGRPWLLLRLAGDHPTAGPLFDTSDQAPCWSCLSFRMLWNQPVRRWYHRTHPGELLPIPVAFRPSVIERELARFAAAAQRLVEARVGDAMTELRWDPPESLAHPVIRRPQCSVCGDSSLYAARAGRPLLLQPAPKAWDEDGGVRTQAPERTARALERILGPVSGLVARVVCHSGPGADVNRIFRAWFAKAPYRSELPRTEQLFQTTLGKGIAAEQSRVSAIGESLERLASNYHGDEPVIRARARELPGRSFPPAALAPYSEQQYRAFEATGDPLRKTLHGMMPASSDAVLDWTPVWSLTRSEVCFVPFTWCYANTPYDEDPRCRFFHSGGAAGNCLEEAILQGFLELVERDAVAVWWYNRQRRPAVHLESLPEELVRQLAATVGVESDYWVLDVTHDFRVPVFVAVSRQRATGKLCLGFGAHLDPRLALRRALTELCQILEIRHQHAAPFDFDAIAPEDYLFPNTEQAPRIPAIDAIPFESFNGDIADDVRTCVARAAAVGLEVLVLDNSRPDFPLRTAKVIMPGACHIFPYRAAARLYEVPVRMGWRASPLTEAELHPLELLI
ncbi:TOMM precursor leader peptide-binding protein [Pendulispora albinea]|uniref:TOMM leader peptide-binding protein n=1 Tax=Pendulispora albinea TaxID=2741071 RepID=A0ABZ2M7C4_9BACT